MKHTTTCGDCGKTVPIPYKLSDMQEEYKVILCRPCYDRKKKEQGFNGPEWRLKNEVYVAMEPEVKKELRQMPEDVDVCSECALEDLIKSTKELTASIGGKV